jgi:phage terminase Nu1 subunit (DNA packaging protein)
VIRQYRHRGCSAEAVSKAIQTGRLRASVVKVSGVPKIRDPAIADREWEAYTDRTRSPVAAVHDGDGDFVLQEELAKEKHWTAKLKEQQFLERDGQLVDVEVMEKKMSGIFSRVRTHLMGVPSRAKQAIPHLAAAEIDILEQLVREALTELVEPEAEEEAEAAG